MDKHTQLQTLIDLAESLGITIRSVPSGQEGRAGALVRLKGKEILFLDSQTSVADRLDVVAAVLKGRSEIEDRFLTPEIREIIERQGTGNRQQGIGKTNDN